MCLFEIQCAGYFMAGLEQARTEPHVSIYAAENKNITLGISQREVHVYYFRKTKQCHIPSVCCHDQFYAEVPNAIQNITSLVSVER